LAQAPSPQVLHQLSACGITAVNRAESIVRAFRSDVITASTHLSACRPRLLATPHHQFNRELVTAWLVTTREISHAPGQALDAVL
jgi:hypothetical protein